MPAKVINFSPAPVYVDQDADDLALVARCRAGDTRAFEPIVERYRRVLYTVALRMLGNAEEANDVAQNAFVKAFQKLDTFDPNRRFFSWIYRILVNECLNARRDQRPLRTHPAGPRRVQRPLSGRSLRKRRTAPAHPGRHPRAPA